jgi:hypothetical protein
MRKKILLPFILLFVVKLVLSQSVNISGTVYDISGRRPVESVLVQSGKTIAFTDSLGRYHINIQKKDSISFSLFGKSTHKFPIDTIEDLQHFNVMIHVQGYDLPEVRVRNSNYRLDSIQNRIFNAKFFNYTPPGIKFTAPLNPVPGSLTIGLDLDEIINAFRFKRNRNLQFLQNRLIAQEREGYVNYRFTKAFVQKISHLEGDALSKFMEFARPNYETLILFNDLELGYYIEQRLKAYKSKR